MNYSTFIVCAIILTLSTGIHTQHIENHTQDPERLVVLSDDFERVAIGDSFEENYVPVIECSFNETSGYHCQIHTRNSKTCKLSFGNNCTMAHPKDVHQIADNRVIMRFVIAGSWDSDDLQVRLLGIFIDFNMDTCTYKKVPANLLDEVVAYENGYNVVNNWKITSYNINGRIRQIKNSLFKDEDISAVRCVKGYKTFFAITTNDTMYPNKNLVFVDYKKGKVKQLIEFGRISKFESHSCGSFYAICWNVVNATRYVRCQQFDEYGNEKISKKVDTYGEEEFLGVRNLKSGGMVLITVDEGLSILHVLTMHSDGEAKSFSYLLPSHTLIKLTNFYEDKKTFNIAYLTSYNELRKAVLLQELKF